MKMTGEGMALIRQFEGFRGTAYRDAVGVWTIGYGHTNMAGPPAVSAGMKISRAGADAILARDVEQFARGVAVAVAVPLSDAQFSALVSFSYNVGLGAFGSSSVLRAVNSQDFVAVPRRLGLWVKAGGRVLPGLIKRRAAEAAMFAEGTGQAGDVIAVENPKAPVSAPSTWAALAARVLSLVRRILKLLKEGL